MKGRRLHIGLSALLTLLLLLQGGFHFHRADDQSSHGGHAHCFICAVAGNIEAANPSEGGFTIPVITTGETAIGGPGEIGLPGVPSIFCIRSPPSA